MAKSKEKPEPESEPERPGYVRTTITVPADLKTEMESIEGQNWSALAAECFRARVAAIKASQRTSGDMDKVIERLKAAAALDAQSDQDDGRAAGRSWAEEQATPAQLRRLDKAQTDGNVWSGGSHEVAIIISPRLDTGDRRETRRLVDEFWERAVGDEKARIEEEGDDGPNEFLTGFIEGACEVWDKVADKI